MNHSEQIDQIVPALLRAQSQFVPVSRADLGAILEGVRLVIAAHGLGLTQTFVPADGARPSLFQTTLWHESGQWLRSSVELDLRDASPAQLEPFRLALICGMLGISAEAEAEVVGSPAVMPDSDEPRAPGVRTWRHAAELSVEHLNERLGRILQDAPLSPDQEKVLAVNVHRLAVAVSKRAVLEGFLRQPEQHTAAWSHKALEWLFAQDRDWVLGTIRAYAKEKLIKARAYANAAGNAVALEQGASG